jgi:hypothetical protein
MSLATGMFSDPVGAKPHAVEPAALSWVRADAAAQCPGGPEMASMELGMSVASAGDVNGDGFDDLVTGGQAYDSGRVRLFLGGSAGLTASAWTTGSYNGAHVGSRAGDVDGDGYADVVVSYPPYEGSNTAAVFLGSPSGLGTSSARFTVSSAEAHPQFGFDLSIAGDLNGDGYADVVVAAPYHDDSRGEISAYLSAPAGLQGN